jgi:glycosyltransferase involved in cell wall biosynthesis
MARPVIVFGMNSWFAVRQFLPGILQTVRDRGFEPVVIGPRAGAVDAPDVPGIEYRFARMNREISPWSDLRAIFEILRILRAVGPEICNMSTPKMALLGGIAAWMAGVPHRIYTLRGLRYETTRGAKRALLMACETLACACAHEVICISRSVRDAVIRDGVVPARKAALLGPRVSEGVTLRGESAQASQLSRQELGIPETAAVMGFVGRLTRDKGIRELVDAFCILRAEGKDIRLLLLGDFEAGDPVDAATGQRIRNDPGIRWLGYVPQPAPYYALMDVFVFPTHREGLGRVLLEAAAAARPVVSTHTTGVVDVVLDGVTGLLVPPHDTAALARAVGTLLGNPDMARSMGARAQTLVQEEFDNSVYLGRLAAMLEEMVRPVSPKEISPSGRSIAPEATCTPSSSSASSRCSSVSH